MSKFLEAVNAVEVGVGRKLSPEISAKRHWLTHTNNDDLITEYRIGVTVWNTMFISDKMANIRPVGQIVKDMSKTFKRVLANEIYGEFREKLFSLQKAVYENDYLAISSIISDIQSEIDGR